MSTVLQKAREEMKQRHYSQAIDLFNEHLKEDSTDLVPLMQSGICHLLNGSEENFLRIYKTVKWLVKKMDLKRRHQGALGSICITCLQSHGNSAGYWRFNHWRIGIFRAQVQRRC